MYSKDRTIARLQEIEATARSVQVSVYRDRKRLWLGSPPSDLIDLFDPGVGLVHVGFSVHSVSAIGEQQIDGVRSEVAGLIDRAQKIVMISEKFLPHEKRFVTAHELGHAVLHPNCKTMHRDIPLERSHVVRDWREIEANRFASAYLLPKNLVEEQFYSCFGVAKFVLSEQSAFALCGANADTVRKRFRCARRLSQCLAGTAKFNSYHFRPLNEQFKVSATAMAIRLEELDLIEYP